MERKGLGKKVTGTRLLCTFLRRRASGCFGTPPWLPLNCLGIPISSLSNENADVPDVRNSNRKFDVSLGGTFLSHTTNLSASLYEFFSSQSTTGGKISTSGCCFWRTGRQGSRCLRSLIWPLWRHFWVPKTLTFWVWLSANSLIWKWVKLPGMSMSCALILG